MNYYSNNNYNRYNNYYNPMNYYNQNPYQKGNRNITPTDLGPTPSVINLEKRTEENTNYRTTLWTGNNFQLTLMSIPVGESIGLEVHPNVDQFLKLEEGKGLVELGPTENELTLRKEINSDYAVIVPKGTYHNITNIGNEPLKLYSLYAPANHPFGTINITKE